mmetsp:Transcript_7430/g.10331  ORF Transcript_7430/g.10331 Transcript_7430/m.10331 type:complete len:351 (-) Transcript_7430:7-1059(-)
MGGQNFSFFTPLDLDALSRLKLGSKLRKLFVGQGIVLEESCLVLGIPVKVLLELWICVETLVGWQPHKIVVVHSVLVRSEVAVVESEPVLRPRGTANHSAAWLLVDANHAIALGVLGGGLFTIAERASSAAFFEHTSDGVRTTQGHNLLIGEAHLLAKNIAQMFLGGLGTTAKGWGPIWQPSIALESLSAGRTNALLRASDFLAAILHGDNRSSCHLDCSCRSQLDQICPGDGRMRIFDLLEVAFGFVKACVGTHVHLRVETDGTIGTPALRPVFDALVVGARVVPCQAHQNRMAITSFDQLFALLLAGTQLLLHCTAEHPKASLRASVPHDGKSRIDANQWKGAKLKPT